jgi:hypothetical protein
VFEQEKKMRNMLSLFLILHGLAHLAGFVGSWGLATSVPAQTSLFSGRIPISPNAARFVGALWLLAGSIFVAAGIAGFVGSPLAATLVVVGATASLLLAITALPAAKIGLAINIAILTAFVFARRYV